MLLYMFIFIFRKIQKTLHLTSFFSFRILLYYLSIFSTGGLGTFNDQAEQTSCKKCTSGQFNNDPVYLFDGVATKYESITLLINDKEGPASTKPDPSKIEWSLTIASQSITEDADVTVTQGTGATAVTGKLKTALTGATEEIVVQAAAGVTFVTSADVTIGDTTILQAKIKTFRLKKEDMTPCKYQPNDFCKNGGYCPNNFFQTACKCSLLYSGTQCEKPITKGTPSQSCKDCDKGQHQESERQILCKACKAGQSQPNVQQSLCIECVKGKWNDLAGQENCKLCSIGKKGSLIAQTENTCENCGIGLYQNNQGSDNCIGCASGKYTDQTGRTSLETGCKSCPIGWMVSYIGASA